MVPANGKLLPAALILRPGIVVVVEAGQMKRMGTRNIGALHGGPGFGAVVTGNL